MAEGCHKEKERGPVLLTDSKISGFKSTYRQNCSMGGSKVTLLPQTVVNFLMVGSSVTTLTSVNQWKSPNDPPLCGVSLRMSHQLTSHSRLQNPNDQNPVSPSSKIIQLSTFALHSPPTCPSLLSQNWNSQRCFSFGERSRESYDHKTKLSPPTTSSPKRAQFPSRGIWLLFI